LASSSTPFHECRTYYLKSGVTSFSPLRVIPPKVPFETLRKIIQYFPTAESEHQLDPSYEDTQASADPEKVKIFKDLQKYQSVGLVVPVDAEFMYFAAMNSTSCRLTALGYQYWRLVNEKRL
jgi:molybdenum cofactor biosynthesis enzyme MoaA